MIQSYLDNSLSQIKDSLIYIYILKLKMSFLFIIRLYNIVMLKKISVHEGGVIYS